MVEEGMGERGETRWIWEAETSVARIWPLERTAWEVSLRGLLGGKGANHVLDPVVRGVLVDRTEVVVGGCLWFCCWQCGGEGAGE